MWTCLKCGRTLKRQEQSHFCGNAPETIEEYIAVQPEEVAKSSYYPQNNSDKGNGNTLQSNSQATGKNQKSTVSE